jgi:hypothetical protein
MSPVARHTTTQLNTAQTGRNQHPIRQKIAPRGTAASRPSSIHHSVTTATASALSRFLVRNSLYPYLYYELIDDTFICF